MKKLLLICLIFSGKFLFAKSIDYQENHLHAFLPESNKVQLSIAFQKINETIDIFNIKESELGSKKENFDSLGDMEGLDINLGYAFDDKWYINLNFNEKHLQYSETELINQKIDLYLRYQVYQDRNKAFSIDGGFITNRVKDTYLRDLKNIEKGLNKALPHRDFSLSQREGVYHLSYRDKNGVTRSVKLKNKPYIGMVDTKDESFYARAIASVQHKDWLFDTYIGYARTKIVKNTESSIFNEDNPDVIKELEGSNFSQNRVDATYFTGFGITYALNSDWYAAFNYEYKYILRIKCLEDINTNHIFNLNLIYTLNPDISLYIGSQLMTNQFNGDIPYLFGEYTDKSFNHKYGFANIGMIYRF